MTRLDVKERWAIVNAWDRLGTIEAVADELSHPRRVVRLWVERYKVTGAVEDLPRIGRPKKLSDTAKAKALDLLLSNKVRGAAGVGEKLLSLGLTKGLLHKTTIIRAARESAQKKGFKIRSLHGKPKKRLTAATKLKRYAFSLQRLTSSWGNVMFTDRKKFPFSSPGAKVFPVTWVQEGQERRAPGPNHALVVNVYAGVTRFGMTKLHVVAGTSKHKTTYKNKKGSTAKNITEAEYKDVLAKTLLPEGSRIFSTQGISTWVLQQDNDPTHKVASAVVKAYNERQGSSISVLKPWPPSSPDLSPIENVWGYLQAKMDAKGCKTFEEYKAELHKEVREVPKEYMRRLWASMVKRLQSCISLDGDKTKY
jgi:hypothetical protein